MEKRESKLLTKVLREIEFEEICDPDPKFDGKVGLVFICPDSDLEDDEILDSRLILARWYINKLTGESMWMEWDSECDGWVGPVVDVVGWSFLTEG